MPLRCKRIALARQIRGSPAPQKRKERIGVIVYMKHVEVLGDIVLLFRMQKEHTFVDVVKVFGRTRGNMLREPVLDIGKRRTKAAGLVLVAHVKKQVSID